MGRKNEGRETEGDYLEVREESNEKVSKERREEIKRKGGRFSRGREIEGDYNEGGRKSQEALSELQSCFFNLCFR